MFSPHEAPRGARFLLGAGLPALLLFGCSRKEVSPSAAPAPAESQAPAGPASAAQAPASLPPLTGLDSCLIGKWKATSVTLKMDAVSAQGGANVALEIAPSGASTIDFTPMADVNAVSRGFSFDFRYSGKASAMLSSPTRGNLQAQNADYAGLHVSATVKLPGAGAIPLFKDKPVSELAAMGAALAGSKGLPKGLASAASSPAAAQAEGPAKGIDSNPVFASNRYTCEGDALSFRGGEHGFEWLFARVAR